MSENIPAKKLRDWWTETGMIETFGPDFEDALDEAYRNGYNEGYTDGDRNGYDAGYDAGSTVDDEPD